MSYFSTLFELITTLFFPRSCLGCNTNLQNGVICEPCFSNIKIQHGLFTGGLGAAASYDDETVKALIRGLKFDYIKDAAVPLAALLVQFTKNLPFNPREYVVLPIPLSKKRLRSRGFNQAELIAKYFANDLKLTVETRALARLHHRKPQSEIHSEEERKRNVKGVYVVARPELIAGKNILLIDDVSTSGSTFKEASLALRSARVKRILALAVAKA